MNEETITIDDLNTLKLFQVLPLETDEDYRLLGEIFDEDE